MRKTLLLLLLLMCLAWQSQAANCPQAYDLVGGVNVSGPTPTAVPMATASPSPYACFTNGAYTTSINVTKSGTSATIQFQGKVADNTDWQTITDNTGTAIELTASGVFANPGVYNFKYMRINITACNSCSVTAVCSSCFP